MKTAAFRAAAFFFSLSASCMVASAQEPQAPPLATALQAVGFAQGATGEFSRGVEITGSAGQPDPVVWTITSYDPKSPTMLREATVRNGVAKDRGASKEYYPKRQPDGFFLLRKVKLDSPDAFKVADKEAAGAEVGFDSIDYRLRCREFTDDPVWTLRLRDINGTVVGVIDMSAESGKVLRTVWVRRDPANSKPVVVDSATNEARALPRRSEPQPREKEDLLEDDEQRGRLDDRPRKDRGDEEVPGEDR